MSKAYKFHDPNGRYFITCTVIQWIDLFTRDQYRQVLIDSLKYCQQHKGLIIHAYCFMTNHIHLIVSRNGKAPLSDIIRDFKKFTSKSIIKTIRSKQESRRGWLHWLFNSNGLKNPNNKYYQVWIQDNHPILLSNELFLRQRLIYLHNNPVKAGIVYAPEDYVYSSASAYMGRREEAVLELDYIEF